MQYCYLPKLTFIYELHKRFSQTVPSSSTFKITMKARASKILGKEAVYSLNNTVMTTKNHTYLFDPT